jgi:hypothetical protein
VPLHYPGADDKNAHTNQYLDRKSHIDCSRASASEAPKNPPPAQPQPYDDSFSAAFLFNKPDSQRIAIVVTVVRLNRCNQQKDKVNNYNSRQQKKAYA